MTTTNEPLFEIEFRTTFDASDTALHLEHSDYTHDKVSHLNPSQLNERNKDKLALANGRWQLTFTQQRFESRRILRLCEENGALRLHCRAEDRSNLSANSAWIDLNTIVSGSLTYPENKPAEIVIPWEDDLAWDIKIALNSDLICISGNLETEILYPLKYWQNDAGQVVDLIIGSVTAYPHPYCQSPYYPPATPIELFRYPKSSAK